MSDFVLIFSSIFLTILMFVRGFRGESYFASNSEMALSAGAALIIAILVLIGIDTIGGQSNLYEYYVYIIALPGFTAYLIHFFIKRGRGLFGRSFLFKAASIVLLAGWSLIIFECKYAKPRFDAYVSEQIAWTPTQQDDIEKLCESPYYTCIDGQITPNAEVHNAEYNDVVISTISSILSTMLGFWGFMVVMTSYLHGRRFKRQTAENAAIKIIKG